MIVHDYCYLKKEEILTTLLELISLLHPSLFGKTILSKRFKQTFQLTTRYVSRILRLPSMTSGSIRPKGMA